MAKGDKHIIFDIEKNHMWLGQVILEATEEEESHPEQHV